MHTILFTVDLEDWFQVENFKKYISRDDWGYLDKRYQNNTYELLDILSRHQVKSTFFILGWNAKRSPELIKEIYSQGHEISSHGYNHDLCNHLSYDELYKDIKKSKIILEDIIGERVAGYRAPSFSITQDLISILKELEFDYDSSFDDNKFNNRHGNINISSYKKIGLSYIDTDGFAEVPVTNYKNKLINLPWSGGGYFRLWPTSIFKYGVNKILKNNNGYVFYTHPWELDYFQPRVKEASNLNKFKHYLNINKYKLKLDNLLKELDKYNYIDMKNYVLNCCKSITD